MKKFRNIINLSKLFLKENEKVFSFIDLENKRINKSAGMFWIVLILFIGITFCSYHIINYLIGTGKPEIFLNGFLLFINVLVIIQSIMLCTNLFYFSKDMESILPLPFKPVEILLSKLNTLMVIVYGTELIFALVPLIIYGIYVHLGILYFINLLITLVVFPIFSILIVSIIMMFLMKTIKIFKNKDVMQIIISTILLAIIMLFLNFAINNIFNQANIFENSDKEQIKSILNNVNDKIVKVNDYFVTINPIANILQENNILKILLYFAELIFINILGFALFYFLGNKLYLKQLLKNNFYVKHKKAKKFNYKRKCKKRRRSMAYIKKEFKLLIKNPLFFLQNIYQNMMVFVI